MNDDKLAISTTTSGKPAEPGLEHAAAPGPIDDKTGMHTSYWVLTEEERAKGFVRPVRDRYCHVGPPGPKFPLRDLTDDEHVRYAQWRYEKYEDYGAGAGRFWTQAQLDRARQFRCGVVTIMSRAIAETYARDPRYYGQTFCSRCQGHLPVGPFGEFVWDGTDERVGA